MQPDGKRVVDFQQSSLHVLNYSTPIHAKLPLSKLKEHLFTLPEHPDWIPVPHVLLQAGMGILPDAQANAGAPARASTRYASTRR